MATVAVTPAAATVEAGLTTQLAATPKDASGNTLTNPVTWSSSATAVASVTAAGLVSGVTPGTATITAAAGGKQGTAIITVVPPSVQAVAVTLAATTIEETKTTTATVVLRDVQGNILTGRQVAWTTANGAVATVNNAGVVTGVAAGTTQVTATSEGKSGSATITVIVRPVNSVSVTLNPTSVVVGSTSQATAVTRDADNNVLTGRQVTFTSSNTTVATVNNAGLITTLAVGTTTITATSEGKAGTALLTVVPPPVATVTVTLTPASVVAGAPSQATFVARDAANNVLTGRVGTWSSSNQAVATINPTTGAITTITAGTTTITATVEGRTGTAQLTVTAPPAFGTVTGTVTAADGVTPIGDALVEVEGTGGPGGSGNAVAPISTRSAPNGTYTLLNVPVGPRVIIAKRGAFEARVNVTVVGNQTVVAPKAALVTQGKLAYVPGVFDKIEHIVSNGLGNAIEEIQVSDLANPAVTSKYRIIFLNCGLDESLQGHAATIANLKAFMQAGGTIYASDYASIYVKDLFPTYDYDYTGDGQTITATVTDASLQAFLGKTSVLITYDLGAWTDILVLPTGASVLLRGTYFAGGTQRVNQPIAFVIPHGSGRLVFTTFHNEAGVTQDQIAVLRHFIYLP